MRIMLGSRMKQRKKREAGIRVGEKVEIIAEVPPFTG
jgi:hypothetical protein